jgi:hypothetical protein
MIRENRRAVDLPASAVTATRCGFGGCGSDADPAHLTALSGQRLLRLCRRHLADLERIISRRFPRREQQTCADLLQRTAQRARP